LAFVFGCLSFQINVVLKRLELDNVPRNEGAELAELRRELAKAANRKANHSTLVWAGNVFSAANLDHRNCQIVWTSSRRSPSGSRAMSAMTPKSASMYTCALAFKGEGASLRTALGGMDVDHSRIQKGLARQLMRACGAASAKGGCRRTAATRHVSPPFFLRHAFVRARTFVGPAAAAIVMVKDVKKTTRKSEREILREVEALNRQEKALVDEVKKASKTGNQKAMQMYAKQISQVRPCSCGGRLNGGLSWLLSE
jgi:hypothetical protein